MNNIVKMPISSENQPVSKYPTSGLKLVAIDNLEKRLASGYPMIFCHGQGLTCQERDYLNGVIATASMRLSSRQDPKRIAHLLRAVVGNLRPPSGMDIQAVTGGYKVALNDIAGEILERALTDFIKGKVENASPIFLPTSAQLRLYCEDLEKFTKSQIRCAQSLLDAGEVAPPKERVSETKLAALVDELKNAPSNQTRH